MILMRCHQQEFHASIVSKDIQNTLKNEKKKTLLTLNLTQRLHYLQYRAHPMRKNSEMVLFQNLHECFSIEIKR
jgi:hypothetical protein